jgi:glucan-binding YG repeat protein
VLVQKNLTSEEELKSYKEKYLTSDSIAELYNKSSFKYEAYYRLKDTITDADIEWIRKEGIKYYTSEEIESIISAAQTANSLKDIFSDKETE